MKTNSIIYNTFVPKLNKPELSTNEQPTFKYTGYKPRYKWSEESQSTNNTQSEQKVESIPVENPQLEQSTQVTFQDPSTIDWTKVNGYNNIFINEQTDSDQKPTKKRGQHIFKTPDIQVGEMQGLLDAFADAGISLRITSGTRPGAKTSKGNTSNHAIGRALDITPVEGQTFEDLAREIRSSPDLIKYMKDHGYGIYDETSPEVLKNTNGTGAHWHIGPDKVAIAGLEQILIGRTGLKIPTILTKTKVKLNNRFIKTLFK